MHVHRLPVGLARGPQRLVPLVVQRRRLGVVEQQRDGHAAQHVVDHEPCLRQVRGAGDVRDDAPGTHRVEGGAEQLALHLHEPADVVQVPLALRDAGRLRAAEGALQPWSQAHVAEYFLRLLEALAVGVGLGARHALRVARRQLRQLLLRVRDVAGDVLGEGGAPAAGTSWAAVVRR